MMLDTFLNITAFVFIGVLGSFTTFSTYSLDTLRLLQEGRMGAGVLNFVANNATVIGTVASSEVVAVEIIRTLVGSIGLVAAVPATTWLGARIADKI